MPSAKPSNPPQADMSALVKVVDSLSQKVLGQPFTSSLPLWKRWLGSEKPEFSTTASGGMRAVVKANAEYLDAVKNDLDGFRTTTISDLHGLETRISALEAAPSGRPFPSRESGSTRSS